MSSLPPPPFLSGFYLTLFSFYTGGGVCVRGGAILCVSNLREAPYGWRRRVLVSLCVCVCVLVFLYPRFLFMRVSCVCVCAGKGTHFLSCLLECTPQSLANTRSHTPARLARRKKEAEKRDTCSSRALHVLASRTHSAYGLCPARWEISATTGTLSFPHSFWSQAEGLASRPLLVVRVSNKYP